MKVHNLTKGIRYVGVNETARRLGVCRETLSRVLHGRRKPSAGLAEKMARMGIRYPAGAQQ